MPQHIPKLLSVREAAERLNVSTKRVYNLIHENQLQAMRVSKRGLRITEQALENYTQRMIQAHQRGREKNWW